MSSAWRIEYDDAYLIQLSCYLHRNPFRAGLVERLIKYPWSSYPVYSRIETLVLWARSEIFGYAGDSNG
jgi:hypothetical protein